MTTGSGDGPVGRVGRLTMATRGDAGPGEVELPVGNGRETFFAHSTEPLPAGHPVLVVAAHADAHVDVVAWVEPPAHG
jgi:hypothetical protein